MWNPEPYIDRLVTLAPDAVRAEAPDRLRRFVLENTLGDGLRRPIEMERIRTRLRTLTQGFVYDRAAQLVFPCGFAEHEFTAWALAHLRLLAWPADWSAIEDHHLNDRAKRLGVEQFLNEGWGFVVNSPQLTAKGDPTLSHAWPLRLGPDVRLTPEEKIWFRSFELVRQE